MSKINYRKAGVDIFKADRLIQRLKPLIQGTFDSQVKNSIGGYASIYQISPNQLLAASTDGVGTKLKLAFDLNSHKTVGEDLVAMSVNDLLCVGAKPLFFLDYFATGKLDSKIAFDVVSGIARGCKKAQCALVGGETAEMPGFYGKGEYDLAGFAVGILDKKNLLPKKLSSEDLLIGIGSSGIHSNGFSLVRKVLEKEKDKKKWAKRLLVPTRIYSAALLPLIEKSQIKAMAHITGSGFLNVLRISDRWSYEVQLPDGGQVPQVFEWLEQRSQMSFLNLCQTFNMGIGMVLVVSKSNQNQVMRTLRKHGEKAWLLGKVVKKGSRETSQIIVKRKKNEVAILKSK